MHYMSVRVLYAKSLAHAQNNPSIIRNASSECTLCPPSGRDTVCFARNTRERRCRQRNLSDGDLSDGDLSDGDFSDRRWLRHVRGDI